MDTVIKALDLIWKMIPALKSVTGERRRKYFDEVLHPLFEAVEQVHDGYVELFLIFRKQLIELKIESSTYLGGGTELSPLGHDKLRTVKNEFFEVRSRDESLRDELRNEAQQIFAQIKWAEEKRLLAAVMYYFLDRGPIGLTKEDLDRDIAEVTEKGGISQWDTPSVRLYLDVRDKFDLGELLDLTDFARHKLNQRHMDVRLLYRRLQHAVIVTT